jgi:hypothetical protein
MPVEWMNIPRNLESCVCIYSHYEWRFISVEVFSVRSCNKNTILPS